MVVDFSNLAYDAQSSGLHFGNIFNIRREEAVSIRLYPHDKKAKSWLFGYFQKLKILIWLFPPVVEVIPDFEMTTWSVVNAEFTDAHHFGCMFHWGHAIMKKASK